MKLQVALKVAAGPAYGAQHGAAVGLSVSPNLSVAEAKGRLAAALAVPFVEHDLVFAGTVLADSQKLMECGAKDGDILDFVARASEATLADQLEELLKARAVSVDELGLQYSHRYGVSVVSAMAMIGFSGVFREFLGAQKRFTVAAGGGCVELAPAAASKAAAAALVAAPAAAKASRSARWVDEEDDDVAPCVPWADEASVAQALAALLVAGVPLSLEDVGLKFLCRHGVALEEVLAAFVATRGCSWPKQRSLSHFVGRWPQLFLVRDGLVARMSPGAQADAAPEASRHERCLGIHDQVCSRVFRTESARLVSRIAACLLEATFLTIHHIVTGGAVGKDTAVEGSAEAEVTLFLESLPPWGAEREAVLRSARAQLKKHLAVVGAEASEEDVGDDALAVSMAGLSSLRVRFAPVYSTHGEAVEALQSQGGAVRGCQPAALAEQEVRFIRSQPEAVKVTARLLKAWRGQRQWSSSSARPSDQILELLAVHAATLLAPGERYDQGEALQRVSALMAGFACLHVLWPAPRYGRSEIPALLLKQRPLLMDPINPFVNIADPERFDPKEMMAYAVGSDAPHELHHQAPWC